MKPIFITGLIVGATLVAIGSFGLRIANSAPPVAALASELSGHVGRYHLLMSTLNARDVFLLDSATGQVWERRVVTDVEGQPEVWDSMDRLDSASEWSEWLRAHRLVKPNPAP